ncbi:DUF4190 domain-containing protein [Streptomyces sp. NPDC059740]|uniref:DUF4190 domain-containing protein n=1 Tax=Streptomyces sp. NPDC059740 TaxID=3346926 RepID=UPI00366654BC
MATPGRHQEQPQYPGYPQAQGHEPYPQGANTPSPAAGNGLAVASLVLGILALISFWTVFGGLVLGLVGLVLGIVGIRKARAGRAPHRGMAIAGTVLSALGLVGSAVILAAGVSLLNSDEFHSYQDCVQHAQSQADRKQCAEDFSDQVNH